MHKPSLVITHPCHPVLNAIILIVCPNKTFVLLLLLRESHDQLLVLLLLLKERHKQHTIHSIKHQYRQVMSLYSLETILKTL